MANRKTATQMLAEACGKPFDEVLEDSSRTFYLSPDEAVEYGLIDKVTNIVLANYLEYRRKNNIGFSIKRGLNPSQHQAKQHLKYFLFYSSRMFYLSLDDFEEYRLIDRVAD